MEDPVAVALERRSQRTRLLVPAPTARLVGPHGERREPRLLLLANAGLEGVGDRSRNLAHEAQATPSSGERTGAASPLSISVCAGARTHPQPPPSLGLRPGLSR